MKFGIAARLGLVLAAVVVLAAGLTGYYAYDVSRTLLIESAKNELLTSTKVLARRIMLVRDELTRNLQILSNHPATIAALEAATTGAAMATSSSATSSVVGNVIRRTVELHSGGCGRPMGDVRTVLGLSLIHISEPTRPY